MPNVGIGQVIKDSISRLRHRVTVEKEVRTKDAAGQEIVTWATRYALQPAEYREVSGGETIRGRQVEAGVVAIFTVNYRDGYDTTDRIVFDGETFGIVRIHKFGGIKRFLDIHCRTTGL